MANATPTDTNQAAQLSPFGGGGGGFITTDELTTHIRAENIKAISRNDDNALKQAVTAAINEACGYLSHYNTQALFTATNEDRDPILVMYIKDIAKCHFINVCNASVDMELAETRYSNAINWLNKIQQGKVVPPNWQTATTADNGTASGFIIRSNPKRGNYY